MGSEQQERDDGNKNLSEEADFSYWVPFDVDRRNSIDVRP